LPRNAPARRPPTAVDVAFVKSLRFKFLSMMRQHPKKIHSRESAKELRFSVFVRTLVLLQSIEDEEEDDGRSAFGWGFTSPDGIPVADSPPADSL
jgi:hypothetical protein